MVHNTVRRIKACELRKKAKELSELADTPEDIAKLEDLIVRQAAVTKQNRKGETKIYYRWLCSWREGDKTITKYLGSVQKISNAKAIEKAKKLKAEALGLYLC